MVGDVTRRLAEFAARLEPDHVPAPVVEHAKVCLLDTLGCGLFGSTLPWTKILADHVLEFEPDGPCTLIGTAARSTPAGAALVNGTAIHAFELDDLHKRSIVHPGSVVISAALAVAEHKGGVSGREFLTAVIAGYEVAARVGMSVGTAHLLAGWHPTGTHGTLGAAAAAGRILRLSPEEMHHALGIAGTQSSGLMASQFASMVKRFHAGRAAQSGVIAAYLARRGFTGILPLFESEYGGYCTTFSPRHDLSKLVEGLGEVWETQAVGFKPYSTNGSCHTTIDALLDMKRRRNFGPDDVERVRVLTSSATKEHVGWAYAPDSATTAQMNLPYIAAVTIADGEAFVDQFSEERIRDEKLIELAGRVEVVADPEVDAKGDGYRHFARVEVRLRDGSVLTDERVSAKGSSAHPMSVEEVCGKYTRLARKALPPAQVDELRDRVQSADRLSDVRLLGAKLRAEKG